MARLMTSASKAGTLVTVKATGISEFARTLYLRTRPDDGKGCGSRPRSDPGTPIGKPVAVDGQYYRQLERSFPTGGNWLVCGWLATSETDSRPLVVASASIPVAGGPALAVQRAVRIGRSVIVRVRRIGIQSGEYVILRLKAGRAAALHRPVPGPHGAHAAASAPAQGSHGHGAAHPIGRGHHHAHAGDPSAAPRLSRACRRPWRSMIRAAGAAPAAGGGGTCVIGQAARIRPALGRERQVTLTFICMPFAACPLIAQ